MKLRIASLLGASTVLAAASAFQTSAPPASRAANAWALPMAKARGSGYGPPLDNISEAVGNTPLVKVSDRTCPAGR